MKTIEDNKLIAEFMGFEINSGFNYKLVKVKNFLAVGEDGRYSKEEDLKFNSSWDWLMPVVEKIKNISINNKFYSFFISIASTGSVIIAKTKLGHPNSNYNNCECEYDLITNTYKAVVEFIKWYNKQK